MLYIKIVEYLNKYVRLEGGGFMSKEVILFPKCSDLSLVAYESYLNLCKRDKELFEEQFKAFHLMMDYGQEAHRAKTNGEHLSAGYYQQQACSCKSVMLRCIKERCALSVEIDKAFEFYQAIKNDTKPPGLPKYSPSIGSE